MNQYVGEESFFSHIKNYFFRMLIVMNSVTKTNPFVVGFAWWLVLIFPIFLWLVEGNFEIKLLLFTIFPYALHSLENYSMMDTKMESILGATIVSYIVLQAILVSSGKRDKILNDEKQRIILLIGYSTMFCAILTMQLYRNGLNVKNINAKSINGKN